MSKNSDRAPQTRIKEKMVLNYLGLVIGTFHHVAAWHKGMDEGRDLKLRMERNSK